MKLLIFLGVIFIAFIESSASSSEKSYDLAGILRKLDTSSYKEDVMKQDLGESDEDDEAVVKIMTNALLSSLMEDEDGEDSIMTSIMNAKDEKAAAQLFGLTTHLLGGVARRVAGRFIRRRLCKG